MHAIFAIEPDAINNWQDLKYALEKFGYSKGLLIARFPKPWPRLVIEACERRGVGDVERARIVEKLRQAQNDRLVRLGLPFDGDDWIANAKQDGVRERLSAILVRDKNDAERFHCLAEVEEALFENRRDVQVKRNAQALAEAARYVLLSSDRIVLVDPYFQAMPKCCKVLEAMVDLCRQQEHRLVEVSIFTAKSTDDRRVDLIAADYGRMLDAILRQGVCIRIHLLSDAALDQDFHARYVISPRAGLRFDRGFVEPPDHGRRQHLTDVVCLDERRVAELNSRYLETDDGLANAESIVLPRSY
ncbi:MULTISPECIES: hypothetical protein [Pseudomonas]|uniref:hypothetical protein n=1 Tax=Pseudomonas TaxID=286 RepID=UPI00086359AB|nr:MULTISPECIES: hypothetical protein [Pseudomonas]EKT4495430.1 hypothetical protein [Pseudomonas putida]EKT4528824.1 hypothetical protein [Pseudomonas putida]MCT8188962.1 hypothetical protein [Pseudomonas monteilii]UFH25204.1 hypothetical protein LMH93_17080 [Pseudomonas sp. CIP-10]